MGYSIGKVFKTIEKELSKDIQIDSIYLPAYGYTLRSLITNIIFVKKHIGNNHYDIIHITGTEHYLSPFLKGQNTIITVHDLGFYTRKKHKGLKLYIKYLLWIKTLKLAKYVTFISERSQAETMQYVKLYNTKVIPNPIDPSFTHNIKQFNDKCPSILHLGTKENKNLLNTIRALENIPCKLTIIGVLNDRQKELLVDYHITYINKTNLSDDEIIKEYQNCDIVNFVSTYEGFGMPIIEAQAIGRIVVTSNIPPMNIIANNAAILVNPFDIKSIREGYNKAIKFDKNIINNGLQNVKQYNVSSIANKYKELYNYLLNK